MSDLSGPVRSGADPCENFAEWFRRQGHRIIRTESSYWVDFGPRVYQAFPYHWLITPTPEELNGLLRRHRLVGLRYSAPVDSAVGRVSYHAVYEGGTYGIGELSTWGRKNVRRGLKHCRVEPISFDRLAAEGWKLQIDTLDRQSRYRNAAAVKSEWERRCAATQGLPGFEAWGALVEDRLGASVITYLMGDCVYMLYQQCHRDFLREHVNNALGFVVTESMVKRPGVKSILYGLHSLDAPPSVDEFKFRMGYAAKPVRQRVVFHPWLIPAFNRATHAVIRKLAGLTGHPTLSKVEGLMRFYREGRRPAEDQDIPQALKGQALPPTPGSSEPPTGQGS